MKDEEGKEKGEKEEVDYLGKTKTEKRELLKSNLIHEGNNKETGQGCIMRENSEVMEHVS